MRTAPFFTLVLLLDLCIAGLYSQEKTDEPLPPKAVITDIQGNPYSETAPLAEVLYFSAKTSVAGDRPESYRWLVEPAARADRMRVFENGRVLVVGTGPSPVTMRVTLIVAKGDIPDVTSVTLKIGGGVDPIPDPTPNPPKPPTPVPTDMKARLQQITSQYNPPGNQRTFVANVFRAAANDIDSGKVATLDALLKATTDAAVAQIGLNEFLKWSDWRDAVTGFLQTQNVKSVKDHAAVWRLIADVLEGR